MDIPCSIVYNSYLFYTQYSIEKIFNRLYPKMFSIHDLDEGSNVYGGTQIDNDRWISTYLNKNMVLSSESLDDRGVYVVDNGTQILVVIHQNAEDDIIYKVCVYNV